MVVHRILSKLKLGRRRPGFRSRFGGIWIDAEGAEALIDRKLASGSLSSEDAESLRFWRANGHVIIPAAVPAETIDRLHAEIEAAWQTGDRRFLVEIGGTYHPLEPRLRAEKCKLLDFFVFSRAALDALFAPKIRSFLKLLFDGDVLAFQSLSFDRGSEQPVHQDTAYVVVTSPLEFAASWIAIEDIQPGSGELVYYEGSHRIEEFLFAGKYRNWNRERDGEEANQRYLQSLHEKSRAMGLPFRSFLPKKGDALIWSADLAHGGGKVNRPELTRKSLVTHYCPARVEPYYFAYERGRRAKREAEKGCWYSSKYYDLTAGSSPA